MTYELEFLPVGNGDSSGDAIMARYGEDGDYTIIVIDGGTKDSGQALVDHIRQHYQTDVIDYVVNTHPDQDHASGLSVVMEQLNVGELWIHRPWVHTAEIIHHFKDQRMTEESLKRRLKEKFSASYTLEEIAIQQGVKINEPYQGSWIGNFHVMSPHRDWYLHELIPNFNKTPDAKAVSETGALGKLAEGMRAIFESFDYETLKEDGETSADNESSTILYATFNEKGFMLTGDAGLQALNHANDYANTNGVDLSSQLKFIQVPHHGSRRNVAPSILNKILGPKGQEQNKTAFVSAGKHSTSHPRKVVINAFMRRGCKVIATQGSTKRHYNGMPEREGWSTAEPLKFSDEVEDYD